MHNEMSAPLTCPACKRRIIRYDSKKSVCSLCGAEISIAASYNRYLGQITLTVLFVLGSATFSSSARGSWFLWMFLFGLVLRFALAFVVPPWFEMGLTRQRASFSTGWISFAVVLCLYYLLLTGSCSLTSDTHAYLEQRESLSFPLALLNKNFYITASTPSIDVAGIALANSFFYGGLMACCWWFVRYVFRRNKVTRMNLSGNSKNEDEDD